MTKEQFKELYSIDMSSNIEKKNQGNGLTLSYLSWPYAWANAHTVDPDFKYTPIYWDAEGNENTEHRGVKFHCITGIGYEVGCEITMLGTTYREYLPVLNGANMPLYDFPYTVTKRGRDNKPYEVTIPVATIMDINTATKRCMVKCLALFGIGLSIYAGEDVPKDLAGWDEPEKEQDKKDAPKASKPSKVKTPSDEGKKSAQNEENEPSNEEKKNIASLFLSQTPVAATHYEGYLKKKSKDFTTEEWCGIYKELKQNGKFDQKK